MGGQPRDAHEFSRVRRRRLVFRIEEPGVNPATDDDNLIPLLRWAPAHQLASSIAADGNNESRRFDLCAQRKRDRRIEFVGTVDGEAEWRSAKRAHQQRDGSRIGPEMRVKMFDLQPVEAPGQPRRFDQISEVPGPARRAVAAKALKLRIGRDRNNASAANSRRARP